MFTGIVEETGRVKSIKKASVSEILLIEAKTVLEGTKVGDSISVNGVCLTVTELGKDFFSADVMAETVRRSSLGGLMSGSMVNLERAMPAEGRFGGHIVSGHIDGTGEIVSFTPEGNAMWLRIKTPPEILKYIVEKGSIAIDGVSLTVAGLDEHSFSVSLIPHTGKETILLKKKPGDLVNLENDIIGKYVERLLSFSEGETAVKKENKLSYEFLRENGFS